MWEWNKYEIVLLIEAVKQINNGGEWRRIGAKTSASNTETIAE